MTDAEGVKAGEMVPYFQTADGRVLLHHGDALAVLRGMAEESESAQFRLCGPNIVERFNFLKQALTKSEGFWGDMVPANHYRDARPVLHGALGAGDFASMPIILVSTELQQQFGLPPLYSQIWQQCGSDMGSFAIGDLPKMQGLPLLSGGLHDGAIATKYLFKYSDSFRLDLLYRDSLTEYGGACIATNSHVIGASFDAKGTIGI